MFSFSPLTSRAVAGIVSFRHWLEYGALATVGLICGALPRRAALGLGAALGQLGWWSGLRRRRVLRNLAIAFPASTPAERRLLGARSARNFGRTVCEFLRFSGRDRRQVLDLVEVIGLEHVVEARQAGRGVAIVTAHLGAWALYVTALAASGVPSTLLVGIQRNRRVERLIGGIPGAAIQLISKGRSAPRELLAALGENRAIVMVADHYSSDQRVFAPFLGRGAFTLPLPGSLVARHGLPLLRMAGHRVAGGHHQLRFSPIAVPDLPAADAMRLEVAVRCNACLGEAILACPEQYFWYHDRWKVRRGAHGLRLLSGDPPDLLADRDRRSAARAAA